MSLNIKFYKPASILYPKILFSSPHFSFCHSRLGLW